jgi:DNA-binding response OmpR family regulator
VLPPAYTVGIERPWPLAHEVEKEVSEDNEQVIDVLLIEDDPETLEMYKLKLEKDGYRVNVALDGEEGVRRATELTPDIIFLDIRLPKKDGFTVLEELRGQESTADIPVIILSNYGEKELVDRGMKLGAMEFLVKAQTSPIVLSEGIDEWLKE